MKRLNSKVDSEAIESHIRYLIEVAAQCSCKGRLIIASFGEDPSTKKPLPPKVKQFSVSDNEEMISAIKSLSREKHRNIYMPLCTMESKPGFLLGPMDKGSENHIEKVFGLVADFDDADASEYLNRLPLPPNYVLETSTERFQTFYLFDKGLLPEEAKQMAVKLKAYANCDHGTADLSHVWRVAGTLNWPNAKKVKYGRPNEPQVVRAVMPWNGKMTNTQDLMEVLSTTALVNEQHKSLPDWWQSGPITTEELTPYDQKIANSINLSVYDYESSSEFDFALACKILPLVDNDLNRADRIIRSIAWREKWDEMRGASTYGSLTLQKALEQIRDHRNSEITDSFLDTEVTVRNPFKNSYSAETLGLTLPTSREWFIAGKGGLLQGKVGVIAGQGGTGKSMLALQIGAAVASGENLLTGAMDIEAKGNVLLCMAEENREDINERLYYLRKIALRPLNLKKLECISGAGDYRLTERDMIGNLKASGQYNDLLKVAKSYHDLKLICIDPADKFEGACQENNISDMTFFMSLLDMLAYETGATVLLLTHVNKVSTSIMDNLVNLESSLDQNAVRGASSIVNNSRWTTTMNSVPDKIASKIGTAERLLAWRVAKSNYSPTTIMKYFKRGEGGVLFPFDVEVNVVKLDELVDAIVNLDKRVTKRTAIEPLKEKLKWSKSTIQRLIEQAIEAGKLDVIRDKNASGRTTDYIVPWWQSGDGKFNENEVSNVKSVGSGNNEVSGNESNDIKQL